MNFDESWTTPYRWFARHLEIDPMNVNTNPITHKLKLPAQRHTWRLDRTVTCSRIFDALSFLGPITWIMFVSIFSSALANQLGVILFTFAFELINRRENDHNNINIEPPQCRRLVQYGAEPFPQPLALPQLLPGGAYLHMRLWTIEAIQRNHRCLLLTMIIGDIRGSPNMA